MKLTLSQQEVPACLPGIEEESAAAFRRGAGRLLSRTKARDTLTLERFREEMRGVYTTCVARNTLDESPMAYKSMDEIVSQIGPTAEIVERIKPIYNFKAGDEE